MHYTSHTTITFPTGLGLPTGEIPVVIKNYYPQAAHIITSEPAVYGPVKSYPYVGDVVPTFRLIGTGELTSWQKDRITNVLPSGQLFSVDPMFTPMGT